MKTIRWGIIGVGDVTEVKSGPGFQKANHSALVAVMRRNADLAQDYAQRHAVPHWYDDAQALIDNPEVDAVYIATPPHVHQDYTVLCAQAGKPVFVEKPMARTHAECQAMVDACQAAGVPLWVAYYRRTLPRFLKIKSLLDSDAIGEVRSVQVMLQQSANPEAYPGDKLPWRVIPEIAGGGLFVDLGSHMLDFLDYVMGPIQAVTGSATNQRGYYPAEDSVSASFTFESGALGLGIWCFNAVQTLDRTVLTGTEGSLTFATFTTDPILLKTEAGEQMIEADTPPHVHQPLIQTIVDELNGRGQCPSTGVSGARTTWVIDQILADYRAQMNA